jgi:hypothetical protein
MITTSGRTTSGLKTLGNWMPNQYLQRNRASIPPPTAGGVSGEVIRSQSRGRPGLEATLSRHGSLPSQTAILGVTADGSPLLLDLADPSPGALLISGGLGNAKSRLLHAILASIILINRPGQAEIRIIAREPAKFDHFFPAEHCRQILSADDPVAGEAIVDLLPAIGPGAYGQAQRNPRRAQAVILAVDDLAALAEKLDKQAFASLCWLARHGTRMRVWLITTVTNEQAERLDELLLSAFKTLLIESPDASSPTAPGAEFWMPLEDQAVPFWICEPEYLGG